MTDQSNLRRLVASPAGLGSPRGAFHPRRASVRASPCNKARAVLVQPLPLFAFAELLGADYAGLRESAPQVEIKTAFPILELVGDLLLVEASRLEVEPDLVAEELLAMPAPGNENLAWPLKCSVAAGARLLVRWRAVHEVFALLIGKQREGTPPAIGDNLSLWPGKLHVKRAYLPKYPKTSQASNPTTVLERSLIRLDTPPGGWRLVLFAPAFVSPLALECSARLTPSAPVAFNDGVPLVSVAALAMRLAASALVSRRDRVARGAKRLQVAAAIQ